MSDLEAFFRSFEAIRVSTIKQRDNKFYAFVTFPTREKANEAMDKNQGMELFGRKLYIDWAGKTYDKERPPRLYNHPAASHGGFNSYPRDRSHGDQKDHSFRRTERQERQDRFDKVPERGSSRDYRGSGRINRFDRGEKTARQDYVRGSSRSDSRSRSRDKKDRKRG